MQFNSISEFFNMGGYAFFVWLSYGVTFFILATLVITSVRAKRKTLLQVANKIKREQKLKEIRSKNSESKT